MKFNLLFIFLFFGLEMFGMTPQIPDTLIYQGKKYEWSGYSPAYRYFNENNLKPPKEALETTGNYGFFIFTYSILDDKLYLTDVIILIEKKVKYGDEYVPNLAEKSVFEKYFPNADKILMKNHTNIQVIPYGEVIDVTKDNWTDIHNENYLIFDFLNGVVEKKYNLNYRGFKRLKRNQFRKYRKTENYKEAIINEKGELYAFNEYRPNDFSMDEYLELIIFRLIEHIE